MMKFLVRIRKYVVVHIFIHTLLSIALASKLLPNHLIGVRYLSYHNLNGTTVTGQCCDDPGNTAGNCTANLCDTAFQLCGTRDPKDPCGVFPDQLTPTTFNNNSLQFGRNIGNGVNTSASLLVFKADYHRKIVNFVAKAIEMPEEFSTSSKTDVIAEYNFVVDWTDERYIGLPHTPFRRFILNDTHAQLVVDVVSMCTKHFFGGDCSVYCKPDKIHYTCLDNGTKLCLPGWEGKDCDKMIDYCPGNKCEHGSTCVPVLMNYTCTCTPRFTGMYCEIVIPTTPPVIKATTPLTVTTAQITTQPTTLTAQKTQSTMSTVSNTSSLLSSPMVPPHTTNTMTTTTTFITKTDTGLSESALKDRVILVGIAAGGSMMLLILLVLLVTKCCVCAKMKGGQSIQPEKEECTPDYDQLSIYYI